MEEFERNIKNILTNQSIATLNCFKKSIDVCVLQCKNAKFGKKKGEYEAYKNVQMMLDIVISELEGE